MFAEKATILKIILLGDSGVGKSSVILRYTEDTFGETSTTVGVDFKTRDITIDGRVYRLQIWDTAGQEKFRTIVKAYYRKAQGILLLYDQSFSSSFDSLPDWLTSIEEHAIEGTPVLIAGNKSDLETVIPFERVTAFTEARKLPFVATSANQGMGIEDAFTELAKLIIDHEATAGLPKEEELRVDQDVGPKKKGCC
jgi:Ras-related protein Rab-1A